MHLLVLSAFRPHEWGESRRICVSMHLLVLSAFRHGKDVTEGKSGDSLNAPFGAQCFPTYVNEAFEAKSEVSMHLLVLSAFRRLRPRMQPQTKYGSQCTFWCSVLSDASPPWRRSASAGLNAPFGAQCFPTIRAGRLGELPDPSQCTFWCSVLSDFQMGLPGKFGNMSQCTFWCSVLSDSGDRCPAGSPRRSQCTFWCSVLSDMSNKSIKPVNFASQCTFWCSVLSDVIKSGVAEAIILSQCTFWCSVLSDVWDEVGAVTLAECLNAPFGAQCFPTRQKKG